MKKISFLVAITFIFLSSQTKAQDIIPSRPTAPTATKSKAISCPPGYTWKGDEWKWDKQTSTYEWQPGKCIRIKRGHIWLPGQWTRIAKGWMWTPGEWRKI
jgi:hypothetical protein